MKLRRCLATLAVAAALVGVACGGSSEPAPTPATAAAPRTSVPQETAQAPTTVSPTVTPTVVKQKIALQSGTLTLTAFLYKPPGAGPFPAIVWNHGSGESQGTDGAVFQTPVQMEREADGIAALFVKAGYVVIAPERRGQGESQGSYIQTDLAQQLKDNGAIAAHQFFVQQMKGPQVDDQLTGFDYLQTQPYVDRTRIAVGGCSYGGIETIFGAARNAGYKAALALSPGAESWAGNPALQQAMVAAVSLINVPMFIIHPMADASLEPGKALGAEFQRLGKAYQLTIYPPSGTAALDGHCFGGLQGAKIWAADAIAFLDNALAVKP
jgi:carboxymethylenebutenolidase